MATFIRLLIGYIQEEVQEKQDTHLKSGSTFDLNRFGDNKGKIVKKEKMLPTHRYIYFHGSKKEKKQMHKSLKMKLYDYPKGQNKRYDSSYKPTTQTKLF
jgi:hypothetical protein